MASEDLEAARAVKDKAARIMEGLGYVCGVGITRRKGVYVIKVNMEEEPDAEQVPAEIDGVPIVIHTVGRIRKQ